MHPRYHGWRQIYWHWAVSRFASQWGLSGFVSGGAEPVWDGRVVAIDDAVLDGRRIPR